MTGVPIFPTGIVKQYKAPRPFMHTLDLTKFTFEKFEGQTKLRTQKFNNILIHSEVSDQTTIHALAKLGYLVVSIAGGY